MFRGLEATCVLHYLDFHTITKISRCSRALLQLTQQYFLHHPHRINHLWILICLNPRAEWDWDEVSANPNITPEIVRDHPYLPWNYERLSRNPTMTWDNLQELPSYRHALYYLCHPHEMMSGWIRSYRDYFWSALQLLPGRRYSGDDLSLNPNITWEFVCSHPKIKWNYRWLSANPNITFDIMNNNQQRSWSIIYYLDNPNLEWNAIQPRLNNVTDLQLLSRNRQVTWDIVQAHPQLNWSYPDLVFNVNITPEIIMSCPQFQRQHLVSNPNFTLDDIIRSSEPFNRYRISRNPHLTWDYISSHRDEGWRCQLLSANPFNSTKSRH